VLPRDVGGSTGLEGLFTLLTLSAPIPDIGYTEGPAGTLYIENRYQQRRWLRCRMAGSPCATATTPTPVPSLGRSQFAEFDHRAV
jgi:hypothetical protein